jgi:hypothetical protein
VVSAGIESALERNVNSIAGPGLVQTHHEFEKFSPGDENAGRFRILIDQCLNLVAMLLKQSPALLLLFRGQLELFCKTSKPATMPMGKSS